MVNINEIYNKVLNAMDEGLLTFMKKVPEPRKEAFQDHFVYCYTEKSIHQAIILKLVRMISGLRATQLLAEHGFVQEQASLQRMLDEIIESVEFLSYAVISGDITERHKEYLEAFYEEMDIESSRNRPMIPRKKLRQYIESMEKKFSQMAGENKDIDKDVDPSRILTKVYSDCLHAAAPRDNESILRKSKNISHQGSSQHSKTRRTYTRFHARDVQGYIKFHSCIRSV